MSCKLLLPLLPMEDTCRRSHGPESQEALSGEPGFLGDGIFLVFINFLVLYLLRYVTTT